MQSHNKLRLKMFKDLLLFFILFFTSFIAIYPSKKEKTNLIDYCYSLEKILLRNSLEKSKNVSKKYKIFAKDITFYSTQKTKGAFVNKIIDQYKISKKSYFMNFVPNQFFCFSGYWIEEINPGTFQSIFYKKSNQKINQYKNIKKEVDELIKNIDYQHEFIKNNLNDFF